jgi:hypothetical protein
MQETNDSRYHTGNALCDTLRFLNDAAYAVLPRDVAHRLGEFEKNLLGSIRWLVEKEIQWIDESLAASDRLREEWRRGPRAERDAG